ncbi:MAG: RcnB family protein [Nitrosomonadaceae bacterium]
MKPYLFLSCLLLSACVATPPWTRGGHIYGDHHAGYYRGHCPPGLAKKHNGCMPPGQAKKWRRGYPLSQGVIFYDLSPRMARQLGRPPTGHHYVRVAQDILMIAIGTGMVVDAVYDLNNM